MVEMENLGNLQCVGIEDIAYGNKNYSYSVKVLTDSSCLAFPLIIM